MLFTRGEWLQRASIVTVKNGKAKDYSVLKWQYANMPSHSEDTGPSDPLVERPALLRAHRHVLSGLSLASSYQWLSRLYLAVAEEGLLDERGEDRIQHVPIQCIHRLIFTAAVRHDTCQERALSQANKR